MDATKRSKYLDLLIKEVFEIRAHKIREFKPNCEHCEKNEPIPELNKEDWIGITEKIKEKLESDIKVADVQFTWNSMLNAYYECWVVENVRTFPYYDRFCEQIRPETIPEEFKEHKNELKEPEPVRNIKNTSLAILLLLNINFGLIFWYLYSNEWLHFMASGNDVKWFIAYSAPYSSFHIVVILMFFSCLVNKVSFEYFKCPIQPKYAHLLLFVVPAIILTLFRKDRPIKDIEHFHTIIYHTIQSILLQFFANFIFVCKKNTVIPSKYVADFLTSFQLGAVPVFIFVTYLIPDVPSIFHLFSLWSFCNFIIISLYYKNIWIFYETLPEYSIDYITEVETSTPYSIEFKKKKSYSKPYTLDYI